MKGDSSSYIEPPKIYSNDNRKHFYQIPLCKHCDLSFYSTFGINCYKNDYIEVVIRRYKNV